MMYLPRLCEHCLNPACAASCPSGAIYKREEDGIVLIDQEKCRGWRMCVSGCPYKKVYYNWSTGKSEKCTLCYPRIESGNPTVCSETCVGRIRYLGVMLYDADKIEEAANAEQKTDLYDAQLDVFLDPFDPVVIETARADGIPEDWIKGAQESPIWKMAMEWKVAFPLHPEYRTLPMVWYIPPLSPIQNAAEAGAIGMDGAMPDVRNLRIPVRYLANMLTAGDEEPVVHALERMLAMRAYMRSKTIDGVRRRGDSRARRPFGPGDRGHVQDHGARGLRRPFRDPDHSPRTCRRGVRSARRLRLYRRQWLLDRNQRRLAVRRQKEAPENAHGGDVMDRSLKALSLILSYPTRDLQDAMPEIGAVLASDTRLTAAARRALRPLVDDLRSRDIYELEEQFVMLFDRSRTLSLNLFEHVHGESRDRGGAMVSLLETYRTGGFEPATSELPDHLPVLLEFLSTRPAAEVQDIFGRRGPYSCRP